MSRDFMQELRAICHSTKPEIVQERLFNINKVSIPICMNKPIVIGVTRQEAAREVARLVKLEQKRREQDGTSIVFIFDIKPLDASPIERSVFYNEGPVCL